MGKILILPETTQNPITLIGHRAGICWGADVSNPEKNYKRGLSCIKSGHGRTFEYVNIESVIEGYSARVIREWYTHIGGAPTRLQESTRYVDYTNLEVVIPKSIDNNEVARKEFTQTAYQIAEAVSKLECNFGIPREDSAMLLPMCMTTKIVDKRNLRNVIDMSHQRMCNRAYWEYRELFHDYSMELRKVSPEWRYIVDSLFAPKCELMGYCPEERGCGKMPKQNDKN